MLLRRLLPVLLGVTLATTAGGLFTPAASAALPAPVPSDYPQTTADPPVRVPSTPSCTEQLLVHDFHSSYYQPGLGTHTPPAACPPPWSRVVLTFSASVGGVQFDRIADVYAGSVLLLSTSTSEPCCTPGATVRWSVQKDVTEYLPLLTSTQPITVFLNNVNDTTYTGVYHVTVSLTFYEAGPAAAPGAHPDVVLPVDNMADSGGDGYFYLTSPGQRGSAAVTFPRNLLRLRGELFAQGHGPCEEFWWGDPSQCGIGTPYREVAVYLDGALAGVAPVYPVVFTGGNGPGFWEPIPSPRAWNLRPYDVDLTPFVGRLVDGAPHHVEVGVLGAAYGSAGGDYWLVGANLLGWTDTHAKQTAGALVASDAPAQPTESALADPSGLYIAYTYSASHALHWSGWVRGSGGRAVTTSVAENLSESTTEAGLSVDSSWAWRNTTSAAGTTRDSNSTYALVNTTPLAGGFKFEDGNVTTQTGAVRTWSRFDEQMTTAAVGLATNGTERETYGASDSAGLCYDRALTASAGLVVSDQSDQDCPLPPAGF